MVKQSTRGQGAFEYLMSYGWAVIIVIILGIVLFNLGVFNTSTASTSSGFSVFRPQSWSATAINASTTNMTFSVTNVAGLDLVVQVNGSASGIQFAKPNCASVRDQRTYGCAAGQWCATDDQGSVLTSSTGQINVPAGSTVVLNVMIFGNATIGYTGCGGLRGQGYRWRVTIPTATDSFNVNHADIGFLSGTNQ